MMLIYGRLTSINVQKVVWCLAELGKVEGRDYKRIDAGLEHGVNDSPEYLAMNPTGLVPTLVDGDFVLWESNAIVRYLAADSLLFPAADPRLRASADRWMDWASATLWPDIRLAFIGLTRTAEDKRDMPRIKAAYDTGSETLRILDQQLGKTRYCTGPDLTVGDVPLALTVHRWVGLAKRFPQQLGTRPHLANLERWYAQIHERAQFRAAVG
jgi:glutathione S-transferase